LFADIVLGAGIAVIAGERVEGIAAPIRRITGIGGARVEVVAIGLDPAHAGAALADIATGARIAVVAGSFVVCVFASLGGVAKVVGTEFAVIAIEGRTTGAKSC